MFRITLGWQRQGWKLVLASWLAIGGAIAFSDSRAKAQSTPDGTLGAENSVVTPNVNINGIPSDRIDGGVIRGTNLFHSFREFNIDAGRGAYFTSPGDIQNILSRVTGNDPSDILGTLGVLGNANLFLINPNGIIFGQNAALDVRGSFVGTTANAIGLANGDIFSANPVDLLPTGLLSVNPNAFFFNQIAAQPIVNRSIAKSTGLQVPQSQNLLLVGGDVRLEGGQMQALGGRVELGGLAASGSVGLSMNNSLMSLSFPEGVGRADVYLTDSGSNRAKVNVAASNGGSIAINARNINISGRDRSDDSTLRGGIEKKLGFLGAQAGDISLNATEEINVANGIISNRVESGATGNAGSINITTGSLAVGDGVQLGASTHGNGNAGNVTITAQDTVSLDGMGSSNLDDGVFTQVFRGGTGNAGNINITTGSLYMKNDVQLAVSTFNQGNAGNVTITARDTVSLGGRDTAVLSEVVTTGVGNAGSINITTGSLYMKDGARLGTSTNGKGNAGSATITAQNTVSLVGTARKGDSTGVFSRVRLGGMGNGGGINITTGSLYMKNGAQLETSTNGKGNAGSVIITAQDTVSLEGTAPNDDNTGFTGVFSRVQREGMGNGGDINITTGSLFVNNGAQLGASTNGQGNGGSINITAGSLSVTNDAQLEASMNGQGDGGSINITAGSLSVTNDARLLVSAIGQGNGEDNGGNINITAGSFSVNNGAQLGVSTNGQGNGGSINITAGSLSVTNHAQLRANSNNKESGAGAAGNIKVAARSILLDNHASFIAETQAGGGANVKLQNLDLLLMGNHSSISTRAFNNANGGNITIDAADGFIVAAPGEDSDIIANASAGQGGNIDITTQGIFGIEERKAIAENGTNDINASSQFGVNGLVEINTPDVDPSQGLVTLPAELVDASNQIATDCAAGGENEFIVTGRGGLPPSPTDPLNEDAVWTDLDSTTQLVENRPSLEEAIQTTNSTAEPVVEATGWTIDDKGQVILIAASPASTTNMSKAQCHAS